MTIEHWQAVSAVLALLLFLTHGRACHWKSRAVTVTEEIDHDGWMNEAKFWRRHFDKESAEWIEESC